MQTDDGAGRGSVHGPRDASAPQTSSNTDSQHVLQAGERWVGSWQAQCLVEGSWLRGCVQISNLAISFHAGPEATPHDHGTPQKTFRSIEKAAVVLPLGAVLSIDVVPATTQRSEKERQRDLCIKDPGIIVACIDW